MKLYNLTLHPQSALVALAADNKIQFSEVEEKPRLKPVADPTNYAELKAIVKEAVKDIPTGSNVLVGGLGQFQALITDLNFAVWFANFNPAARLIEGVIRHECWTRHELFDIENNTESARYIEDAHNQ